MFISYSIYLMFQTLLQTLHLCGYNPNLEIHYFILNYYSTLLAGLILSILFLFYAVLCCQSKLPQILISLSLSSDHEIMVSFYFFSI